MSLACCLSIFLGFGAAIWSQLTIGWQWSESSGGAATAATIVTSAAMLAFLVLALLAAAPVVWVVGRRIVRGRGGHLLGPAAVVLAGAAVTFAGGRYFGNGWPGTGAHRGFVPGGLAAFSWASTLSVSSYWAHPSALARLISFDKRGTGLSDRVQAGTLDERMDDVRAVMDAAGSDRAVLLGESEGGPLSMLFAAAHPERVAALVLCGGQGADRSGLAVGRRHRRGTRAASGVAARALGRRPVDRRQAEPARPVRVAASALGGNPT